MNRLLKVEMYRLKHSQLIKYLILGCLLVAFFPLIGYVGVYESLSDVTAEIGFAFYGQTGIMLIIGFVPNIICVHIGRSFKYKMINYEIMEGHSNSKIIISRIISCVTVMTIGIMACIILYLGILAVANGKGDTLNYFGVRIILMALYFIHLIVMSVLLCMTLRNGVLAAVVIYFRCTLLDMGILAILQGITGDFKSKILNFFLAGQWSQITTGEINANLVIWVVVSLIIENGILFIIALYGMKKKEFR